MNKKESNKVNSFSASTGVMIKNEPIWTGSANVTRQFGLIQVKMPLVSSYDQKQNTGEKPSSEVKKNIKNNVIPMAVKLSKSAVAYFAGVKNIAMEFSAKLTKSRLEKLKENTLLTELLKFYNIILPFKDQLEHLNPTDVADFKVMLDDLKKALPQPQVETDESKTATYNIGVLIHEINELFKELDKYIAPYEYTHPDFYRDYMNSRVMKDLRGKATQTKKVSASKTA